MRAGDVVPPLERAIELADMVACAGAMWDWHRLHCDPAFVERAQLPGPLVDGQVLGALLAEQVLDWLGPKASIRTLHFRFASMVFAGDTVRCTGPVAGVGAGVGEGGRLVTVDQQVLVGDRVVVEPAGAEVLVRP